MMTLWVPPSVYGVFQTQYIRMLGQHYKYNGDLLTYFLDAKLKQCSQVKLKIKCLNLWLTVSLT